MLRNCAYNLLNISIKAFCPSKQHNAKDGSPGLVVMGDDSCLKGRGFKSRHRILDGLTFFHIDLL